jgi:plastocyanin
MMMQHLVWPAKARIAIAAGALILIGGAAWAVGTPQLVSQKDRIFNPGEITISRGESVHVVNDDGDLWHDAYIESAALKFHSGGQKPGSSTAIAFPTPGNFDVLCAIHPKMKLIVHVQ